MIAPSPSRGGTGAPARPAPFAPRALDPQPLRVVIAPTQFDDVRAQLAQPPPALIAVALRHESRRHRVTRRQPARQEIGQRRVVAGLRFPDVPAEPFRQFQRLLLREPVAIAPALPVTQVLRLDRPPAKLRVQHRQHLRLRIQPRHQAVPALAIVQPAVEFIAHRAWQPGDLSDARFAHSSFAARSISASVSVERP